MSFAVVILAAGQGVRMRSSLPKVLHRVAGVPMVQHVLNTAEQLGAGDLALVIGRGAEQVRATLDKDLIYVEQTERLGTGHAVQQAAPVLRDKADKVMVLYGDMPLITMNTLRQLLQKHEEENATLTMLTARSADPHGFGRIVRDETGKVLAIVEEADATPEQKLITELNTGIYCFRAAWLWDNLERIPLSAKGEYYLTDLVEIAVEDNQHVAVVTANDFTEFTGINTRVHLAEAEAIMRQRINERLMLNGVTIIDPASTYIDASARLGIDCIVYPNTFIQGKTVIGRECGVGPNAFLRNAKVGNRCRIISSMVINAVMDDDSDVGPFSHLRSGAHLGRHVHVGNFGEIKKSYLGDNTKMGHFSYVGDADIGRNVNVGAGTITCNFDGAKKHATVIEDDVFIGSDAMLVAPVCVKTGARIGAGSVVTKDVPAGSIAYGVPARVKRTPQAQDLPTKEIIKERKTAPLTAADKELIEIAIGVRELAYAPYSGYKVGAALRGKSGRIYTGCNVENVAFGPTICAERTAVVKAVSEGEREFSAIAVVTANGGSPCGVCRQVLHEFGGKNNLRVIVADLEGNYAVYTIGGLLPEGFGSEDLQ